MILTIIAMLMIPVGVWMVCKDKYEGVVFGIGLLLTVCGGVLAFCMVVCIIISHIGVDAKIEENRIEYEALCQRYEIVTSEYEDVSKSDVIKDIAEWNKNVYSEKHWAYNPWTSWFYSKMVADDMKMIERKAEGSEE